MAWHAPTTHHTGDPAALLLCLESCSTLTCSLNKWTAKRQRKERIPTTCQQTLPPKYDTVSLTQQAMKAQHTRLGLQMLT
jgi:hypothetical protein